jgi:hypothetical protein
MLGIGILIVIVGLLPGSGHCSDFGAAERPQDMLYDNPHLTLIHIFGKFS